MITRTMTLRGLSLTAINAEVICFLLEQGYWVVPPEDNRDPGETCTGFCARLGIRTKTLCTAWRDPATPRIRLVRGKSGNVRRLWSTPAFEAWLLRHKS
jgi:hypothetical protein